MYQHSHYYDVMTVSLGIDAVFFSSYVVIAFVCTKDISDILFRGGCILPFKFLPTISTLFVMHTHTA